MRRSSGYDREDVRRYDARDVSTGMRRSSTGGGAERRSSAAMGARRSTDYDRRRASTGARQSAGYSQDRRRSSGSAGASRAANEGYDRRRASAPASVGNSAGASGGRRLTLVWVAVVAVLVLIAWWVIGGKVRVIRNMEVAGNVTMTDEEVIRLSRVEFGGSMRDLDEESVRRSVESDGRLAFVALERRYPDTVVLTVRERTRDAYMQQAGKLIVLDADGYVVEVTDSQPQSIPYVTGIKPSGFYLEPGRQLDRADGRVNAMKAVLQAAMQCNATGDIAMIDLTELSDLRIQTHSGMTVLLGNADNMADKINFMAGALSRLESEGNATGTLDVAGGDKADHSPLKPVATATPTPETPAPETLPPEAEAPQS